MSEAHADLRISLLICDDHRVLTDALATIVGTDPSLVLVADPVENAEDAIVLAATHRPDVVLMDIDLGAGVNGIEGTRRIKAASPATNVVILSGHRRRTVLVEAVEAGACGFLDKSVAVGDVLSVVKRAAAGDMIIDPRLLANLMTDLAVQRQNRRETGEVLSRLTKREREVLELLTTGLGNGAIAERLYISAATARTHVQNILTKLGAHSKLEAVAIAARASHAEGLEAST